MGDLLSVLFVDDEPAVLEGLRLRLRRERLRWNMVFVSNGEAALTELRRGPVDVLISDMRMPGMDGATLLTRAQKESPSTVRIILSGYAEQSAIMRALPAAQQFLSKPCDAELICSVISRAGDMKRLLNDSRLQSLIGTLETLPAAPTIYHRLTETLAADLSSMDTVAKIIERDPALAAKVLQVVNSSYFGPAQNCASVAHAVKLLGGQTLQALALMNGVFSSCRLPNVEGLSVDHLQKNALLTARLAKAICRNDQGETAFIAALLHDVGHLILAMRLPTDILTSLWAGRTTGEPTWQAEMAEIGTSHAAVGAYLLGLWGLPLAVVEAVALHHTPHQIKHSEVDVLLALHVADVLTHSRVGGPSQAGYELDMDFARQAGAVEQLGVWEQMGLNLLQKEEEVP